MPNPLQVRRLRSIAWSMNLWDASFFTCCVLSSDYELLSSFKDPGEWFQDMSNDEQFLFVLLCAEAIEQGSF